VPVVPGDVFGCIPVRVVEEIVDAFVLLEGAIHHIQTMVASDRHSEDGPDVTSQQPGLQSCGLLLIYAVQKLTRLLASTTAVEMAEPEHVLIQKLGQVGQRSAEITR
jgi:hypothetical protein